MGALFKIKDTTANKISYYHLMLLLVSMPFDMFYSHLILISYGLHTFINFNKKAAARLLGPKMLLLQSVFFITLLSTIYTINYKEAFTEWGKQITIFIIPLLFCLNPIYLHKYRDQLLLTFSLVCTATVIYLFADSLITIHHYHFPLKALFSVAFTNHNFSEPINMHATFFSMQVVVALVCLVASLIKEPLLYKRLLYLTCCVILLAGLIQLSSKSILIVLIILFNLAFPYFLLKGKKRLIFIAATAIVTIMVFIGILTSNSFKERYINGMRDDLSLTGAGQTSDSRLTRWMITKDLIKKSPVVGYGAGSEIGLLQDGFYNHKLYSSYLNRLNTHSQYLSFWLKSGVIGLLVYLATMLFGIRTSFRNKDILFFTFMLLIVIISLSENLLDVDKGIIFYAFFFSFFIYAIPAQSMDYQVTDDNKYLNMKATKQALVAS